MDLEKYTDEDIEFALQLITCPGQLDRAGVEAWLKDEAHRELVKELCVLREGGFSGGANGRGEGVAGLYRAACDEAETVAGVLDFDSGFCCRGVAGRVCVDVLLPVGFAGESCGEDFGQR